MQYLIIEGWVRLGIAFHERHIRLELWLERLIGLDELNPSPPS